MTNTFIAPAKAMEARISAVVTRADGRVEDLGTVAYWHRNPLRRLLWAIKRHFGKDTQ